MIDFLSVIANIEDFCATPEQLAAYEEERRIERVTSALSTAGIPLKPEDLKQVVHGPMRQTEALTRLKRWAIDPEIAKTSVVVMCGPLGVGKTMAAAWLLGEFPGYYTTLEELARCSDARFGEDAVQWKRWRRCQTLVVDELGAETHQAARKAFHELVDWRCAKGQRTLFLSNLQADVLKGTMAAKYDPRTIDRLRANGRLYDIKGQSMRKSNGGGF